MVKYHITDDYKVSQCRAEIAKCRYFREGETVHFETEKEALSSVEEAFSTKHMDKSLQKEKASMSDPNVKHSTISLRDDGTTVFSVVQKPSIYGFISTKLNEANDAYIVKVGYTSRPAHQRFAEWQEKGGIYSPEYFEQEFVMPAIIKDPETGKEHYVKDYNFHKYFERNGFQKLIDRDFNTAGTDRKDISKEFYIGDDGKRRITQEIIDDCVRDQESNIHNSGSGYTFYGEAEQKTNPEYTPTADFSPRSFQEEVIERTSSYYLNSEDNSKDKRFLLTAPTRSGKSFMAAQTLLRTFDNLKKQENDVKNIGENGGKVGQSSRVKKNHCAVVVSGFAEIEDEWKKTFQTHKDFNQKEYGTAETNKCGQSPCVCSTKFKYLSKKDLEINADAVEEAYANGAENVVVFLTLQDLAGSTSVSGIIKSAHKFLEKPGAVDMIVGDEAHLAMFTEDGRYQEALNGYSTDEGNEEAVDKLEKADNNLSTKKQKEASQRLKQITPNVGSLFITATPYNVLSDGSKFDIDKNVVIITEEQILEEKHKWDEENFDKELWESPYYGLPEKKFFGLDVGVPANELFNPVDTQDGSKGFKNKKHVQQIISGLFGKGGIAPNIMKDTNFAAAGIGNNVYATLPYCASCDAMEEELNKFLAKNGMADEYEVLNISSAKGNNHPITKLSSQEINQRISESKKKTITLTVNRMGTGVTQEKWDTVLMMRGLKSAQQFEQTAGRCGTPYVKDYESNEDKNVCQNCRAHNVRSEGTKLCQECFDKEGQEFENGLKKDKMKHSPKPNVAVITFDPVSMVQFKRNKAVSLAGNQGKTTDEQTSGESVDESLDRSLKDIEHFIYKHDKVGLQQLDRNSVMEWYLKGMRDKSVGDIANGIKVLGSLNNLDEDSRALLSAVHVSGYDKNPQTVAASSRMVEKSDGKCWVENCQNDVREGLTTEGNSYRLCEDHAEEEKKRQQAIKDAEDKKPSDQTPEEKALIAEKKDYERNIRNTYARTLFYAMLSESNETGLRTIIDEIEADLPSEENGFVEGRAAEMARHLDLDLRVMKIIRDNNIGGLQLDDSIRQMELILAQDDEKQDKWERLRLALNSFRSLSNNEILTPREVSSMLVDKLAMNEQDWQKFRASKSGTIDVGCKSAVNLVEFYDRGLANGLPHGELRGKMYSVPTSGASYELISKVYDEYDWDKSNILFVDGVDNLDTLRVIALAKEMKECQAVDPETCQYHKSVKNGGRGTSATRLGKEFSEILDKIDDIKVQEKLRELMDKVKDIPKFDYVISNPPYQIETRAMNDEGVGDSTNIFPAFQIFGATLGRKTSMIYPGGRWVRGTGKGCRDFGPKLLNDEYLQNIDLYSGQDAKAIFPSVNIGDGLSVVFLDSTKPQNAFSLNGETIKKAEEMYLPLGRREIIEVVNKATRLEYNSLNDKKISYQRFRFNDTHAEGQKAVLVSDVNEKPPSGFINPIKAMINNTSGKKGRVGLYWIENSVSDNSDLVDKWKIVMNSNVQGNEAASDWKFHNIQPGIIYGSQRIPVNYFDTKKEADNFYKFVSTSTVRTLITAAGGSRNRMGHNLMSFVPDLEDYTDNNPDINWNLPLDPQLYKLLNLTEEEIKVIEEG